jgi:glycerophosphoryl diester phosphodiesterase
MRAAIIAHRGASRAAPENTLAAFRLAWEMGSDAIELDLHLASDGQLVVIHDSDTRRTTGVAGPVGSLTLEQIRRLDAGSWKDPRWKGERIPTLREVLDLTPKGKQVVVELKDSAALLGPLAREIARANLESDRIILIGFDHALMVEAKGRFPAHPIFWLYEFPENLQPADWRACREALISQARRGGLDGLDLEAHPVVDAAFVREIHAAGLKVLAWTVNDLPEASRLIAAVVDGITTDVPDLLLAHRAVSTGAA